MATETITKMDRLAAALREARDLARSLDQRDLNEHLPSDFPGGSFIFDHPDPRVRRFVNAAWHQP